MVDTFCHYRQTLQQLDASTLLQEIAEGTWVCGRSGPAIRRRDSKVAHLQGHGADSLNQPCSEYVFPQQYLRATCSLNLMKFNARGRHVRRRALQGSVWIYITAQEILVDNASYPTREIAENSHIFRTLGLGFANLGSLIMSYGLPYDSDEGRALAGAITAIMTGHAYEQSAEIAGVMAPSRAIAMPVARM